MRKYIYICFFLLIFISNYAQYQKRDCQKSSAYKDSAIDVRLSNTDKAIINLDKALLVSCDSLLPYILHEKAIVATLQGNYFGARNKLIEAKKAFLDFITHKKGFSSFDSTLWLARWNLSMGEVFREGCKVLPKDIFPSDSALVYYTSSEFYFKKAAMYEKDREKMHFYQEITLPIKLAFLAANRSEILMYNRKYDSAKKQIEICLNYVRRVSDSKIDSLTRYSYKQEKDKRERNRIKAKSERNRITAVAFYNLCDYYEYMSNRYENDEYDIIQIRRDTIKNITDLTLLDSAEMFLDSSIVLRRKLKGNKHELAYSLIRKSNFLETNRKNERNVDSAKYYLEEGYSLAAGESSASANITNSITYMTRQREDIRNLRTRDARKGLIIALVILLISMLIVLGAEWSENRAELEEEEKKAQETNNLYRSQLEILNEASLLLSQNILRKDAKMFTREIHTIMKKLFQAEVFSIGIYNPYLNNIKFDIMVGEYPDTYTYSLTDDNKNRIGYICFKNEVGEIHIDNVQINANIERPKTDLRVKTVIAFRLQTDTNKIGVLSMQRFDQRPFTEKEQLILKSLSKFVSVLIENMNYKKQEEKQQKWKEFYETIHFIHKVMAHDYGKKLGLLYDWLHSISFEEFINKNEEDKKIIWEKITNYNGHLYKVFQNLDLLRKRVVNTGDTSLSFVETTFVLDSLEWDYDYILAKDKNLDIIIDIPKGLLVIADKNLIQIALRNLVNNAIQNTSKGHILITAKQEGSRYIEISVADTGVGISEKKIEALLQTKLETDSFVENSGRGLFIVKTILIEHRRAQQIDCVLKINSEIGKGSTFLFHLLKA